ncbi:MAG: gliding motility-associated C-terminal domain-containing protein [Flavobacteriales bacterium]|nr:gliding motility-associated C-terminal domain-containing protein [Flavobacteriales bacterium]
MKRFALSLFIALPIVSIGQTVNGDAEQLSCNCYRLTEAIGNQSGSVWNSSQISLADPFDYTFDVYLGDIPGGADGIAFVLQPISTQVGSNGGGMGYEGISPSLAMSIDTYDNGANDGDIPQDHVAIMSNGSVEHFSADNLAGPEIALVSGNNIEDGQWHVMRVTWDPVTMIINFYMDGSLRTTYTGDIINDIFGGDPNVFWGFTGSTGGLYNQQEFCFSIIPGLSANSDEICAGDSVLFEDDSYSALGVVESWDWDFDNGQTSQNATPGMVQFPDAGTYWVTQTIVDAEGCDASDSLQIVVHPNPVADFSATDVCQGNEMNLMDESSIVSGSVSDWSWNLGNGETDFGSSVSVVYSEAGTYNVTLEVSSAEGCTDSVSSTVTVFENPVAEGAFESNSLDAVFTTGLNNGDEAYWIILDTAYTTLGELNYTFPDSGWYDIQLVVTNANGCMDTADYSIYVEGLPEYDLPNVFTPNGDDFNEWFQPETYAVVEANMHIFNRWGRPVFTYEGAIPQTEYWGWDGTINGGAKAESGTYYYVLDLKGVNGDNFSEQGTVTLLR